MLQDKIIFLAGACGLIGKSFARAILQNNAKIIIADINKVTIDKLYSELAKEFSKENIYKLELDINSKTSIEAAIEKSVTEFGRIDAVLNTSYPRNKNYGKHFFDVSLEDFNQNVSIHLGGYFLVSQLFAKYFIDKKIAGNILNLSSIYGVIAPKFEVYNNTPMTMPVEYAAIKSALIHLTAYMAKYLKGKNIRVNCISPGGIFDNQPQTFVNQYNEKCFSKGLLNPDDLVGVMLFLLSDGSKVINGQNIIVDDGFTL